MGNPFGRSNIVPLTNKSGASVAAGDFVYVNDGSNAGSFTTGTTANRTAAIGIAQQTIANGAVGLILIDGYASLVNVNASVTLGHFLSSFTVAKQGTDAGASRQAGTCGVFMTGGATPDAIIWQPDLGGGSGMANPMTTAQDLIYGTNTATPSTPGRLGIGAAGGKLGSLNSVLAYDSGTSFPSAVTGDRYYRTDILSGTECVYDGTRWLGPQLARAIGGGQAETTLSASTAFYFPTDSDYDLWLDKMEILAFCSLISGTQYWQFGLYKTTAANADTQIGSTLDDKSDTQSNWTLHKLTLGAAVAHATYPALKYLITKVSTPNNTYASATLYYRRIYT